MHALTAAALALLAPLALADPGVRSEGGPYVLDWYTIDGGGGTSSGGPYTLSGTIGQPDAAAPFSGGPYTLEPGFWPGATGTGAPCPCDLSGPVTGVPDGVLNVDDVAAFVTFFSTSDPRADISGPIGIPDGVINIDDIAGFIDCFADGCP